MTEGERMIWAARYDAVLVKGYSEQTAAHTACEAVKAARRLLKRNELNPDSLAMLREMVGDADDALSCITCGTKHAPGHVECRGKPGGKRVAQCPKCGSTNTEEYPETRVVGDFGRNQWRCLDCDAFFQPGDKR